MPWNMSKHSFSSHRPTWRRGGAALAVAIAAGLSILQAQETPKSSDTSAAPKPRVEQTSRFERFARDMSSVRLKGTFTIAGKPDSRSAEEYIIESVRKLPRGDKWLFRATIRYGKVNLTLPLVLDVRWAGETPVITLDRLTIPTLGTFSARVLIHDGRYAGTWQHDATGGHLFGTVAKVRTDKAPAEKAPSSESAGADAGSD